MKLRTIAIAAVLALGGCVQTATLETPFDNASHEFASKPGNATVTGQAFMRRNDGVVVYAAGSPVYLLPQTAYTSEMLNKSNAAYGNVNFTNADGRLVHYTKRAQANGEGRFTFNGIPDGPYIIITNVNWMAGDMRQGGDLSQRINVTGGQNVDAILTR